ncbi:MAG: TetR/AcrR family transcriptional regulator [Bacillales bacterium]|jgi:AcrR family transcriptional regulator|nr:TetR/AcrR family transcriptional regulator [Bacillales bacterium]
MQSKKKEIEESIIQEAKSEFLQFGYLNANLRSIAKRCHITTSNIYRYYESKALIFEAIVKQVYLETVDVSLVDYQIIDALIQAKNPSSFLYRVARKYLLTNTTELLILWNGSQGSVYENYPEKILDIVAEGLVKYSKLNKEKTIFFANLILSSVAMVLQKYHNNPKMIDEYLQGVLPTMVQNINNIRSD